MPLVDRYRLSLSSVGILLVFFIPRVPGITINQDTPLVPATGSFNSSVQTEFMTAPANFSFPAFAQLQVDTGSNFIPLQITHMNAQVFDLDTNNQVGNGDVYGLNLPAKQFVNLQMPVNFSYIANNSSDITCEVPLLLAFSRMRCHSYSDLFRGELAQRLQKPGTIRRRTETR
jgi:hypothetical protein